MPAQIDAGDADPLEPQFPAPRLDGGGQLSEFGGGKGNGHGNGWN
ncbi:MAG: hypothetical protein U1F59_05245 [Candidatus Competibacteraceae bacterium]